MGFILFLILVTVIAAKGQSKKVRKEIAQLRQEIELRDYPYEIENHFEEIEYKSLWDSNLFCLVFCVGMGFALGFIICGIALI